ncbi:MAG TPA: hypothetical protein VF474_16475 [Phenylobacterium sp.]
MSSTMGGGSKPNRPADGNVARAGDLLPTAALLQRLKAEAWDRCQAKAFAVEWPIGPVGLAVVQMTPIVAMLALGVLCPAPPGKLAVWLRVDPQAAFAGLNRARSNPWASDMAAEIVELLEGQG